jgi:hypothetical protein
LSAQSAKPRPRVEDSTRSRALAGSRIWRRAGILARAGVSRIGAWNLALFLGALALYLVVGAIEIVNLKLDGDEPWYVMLGYSIVHNHTVDLAAIVHNPSLYSTFTSHWDDHTKDFLGNGERLMPNLPGYSAIIGVCYFLANRAGILAPQAVATATTVVLLFHEGRRLLGGRAAGLFAALAFVFALPALLYVGQAFPSALASFLAFAGFVLATHSLPAARGRRQIAAGVWLGIACALLPWLHFKYALVALALLALAIASLWPRLRWPPSLAAPSLERQAWSAAALVGGMTALSFALIGLYCRHYFGAWTPQYATAAGTGMDFAHPDLGRAAGLYADMFLNFESGLLPWVPLDFLVPIGVILLWRRDHRQAAAILLCVVAQLAGFLPVFFTTAIYQGYALPSRFTVECAPFFALCVAAVFAPGFPALRVWWRRSLDSLRARRRWRGQARPPANQLFAPGWLARALPPVGAASALALLLIGAWLTAVGAHDPGELYNNPGGNRIAEKYPSAVPAWWFALFPDPSHNLQFTHTLTLTPDVPAGASPSGQPGVGSSPDGTTSVSARYNLPPGRYTATFAWSCARTVTGASASSAVVELLVEGGGGRSRAPLVDQRLDADQCSGSPQTLVTGPFSGAGYITTGFRIVYGPSVTITNAQATYIPARP